VVKLPLRAFPVMLCSVYILMISFALI